MTTPLSDAPTAGVLSFNRSPGTLPCTVVAGNLGVAWQRLDQPDSLLGQVAQTLRRDQSAPAGHWIFGGPGRAEGHAHVSFRDAAGRTGSGTLQVLNTGPDTAVLTLSPDDTNLSTFQQSTFGSTLLRLIEGTGTMLYAQRADDGFPLFASEELQKLYQLSLPQLQADPAAWHQRLLPESRPLVQPALAAVLKNGRETVHYRIQDAAGRIRDLTHSSLLLATHQPPLVIGLVTDRTAFTSLDELARSQLRGLEQSREGFALTDAAGCFTYMNPEHLRIFGFREMSEVVGQSWQTLYDEESLRQIQQEVFPVIMAQGSWHGITRAKRKDGSTFSEDLTLSLLPGGCIACNCRDRTDEVEAQDRLARSEALFHGFADNVPAGVMIKNAENRYQYVNKQMARYFGTTADQLIGRSDQEILPPRILADVRRTDEEIVRTGTGLVYEYQAQINGRDYEVETTKFPLYDQHGKLEFLCAIHTDITGRKQLEQEASKATERQAELMTMQREFVSMISHEFRTPLTAMMGAHFLLQKLLEGSGNEKVTRMMTLQKEAMEELRELVSQTLFLNRLTDSSGDITTKTVAAAATLDAVIGRSQGETLASRQRIVLTSSLPAGCTLDIDESLFNAAVENILSNALKYSPADSTIDVEASSQGGQLRLVITNQGRGIPRAELGKIFTPFFRGSNVGVTPGTGLGLTIVKRAIDFHHGHIECESEEGSRTTFRLFIPLTPAALSTVHAVA